MKSIFNALAAFLIILVALLSISLFSSCSSPEKEGKYIKYQVTGTISAGITYLDDSGKYVSDKVVLPWEYEMYIENGAMAAIGAVNIQSDGHIHVKIIKKNKLFYSVAEEQRGQDHAVVFYEVPQ